MVARAAHGDEPYGAYERGVMLTAAQTAASLTQAEREIGGWPGVERTAMQGGQGQGGFQVPPGIGFRVGRRDLGHIHVTGDADSAFTRALHDELIAAGRARAHGAGFPDVVTDTLRGPDDVAAVVALFGLNYDRANANANADADADAARRRAS